MPDARPVSRSDHLLDPALEHRPDDLAASRLSLGQRLGEVQRLRSVSHAASASSDGLVPSRPMPPVV